MNCRLLLFLAVVCTLADSLSVALALYPTGAMADELGDGIANW